MNKSYKAFIFDMDGTLIDSMWIWKDIDIEYLARFGHEILDGLQKNIEGMSFHQTAIYFKEHFNIPDNLDKIKEDWNKMAYDKYTYEVKVKKGVFSLLDYAKNNNIKLGIATSNSRELTDQILKVHNLTDYFDVIVTGSEVINGKPAPDIYLKAAEKLMVSVKNCLVFEDIIPGIKAGKNAGMDVCAVPDDYSKSTLEEKRALADYFVNYIDEVINEVM